MKNAESEKSKGGFRPGFSKRFNYFLDIAKYPEMNKGRVTLLADDEAMSRTGVRGWILEDNPPKGQKLVEVCQRIISERMGGKYNPTQIAGWLEYGDDIVQNPFKSTKAIQHIHSVMSNIYVTVHSVAKELGIDLNSMDDSILDPLYKELMEDVVASKLAEADPELVKSLLVIANRKWEKIRFSR